MDFQKLAAINLREREGVYDVKVREMGEYVVFDYYETERSERPSGSKRIARDWFDSIDKTAMATIIIENAPYESIPLSAATPIPFDDLDDE